MGWFQLAIALAGLMREVLRYLSQQKDGKAAKTTKLKEVREAIKDARLGRRRSRNRIVSRVK